MNWRTGNGLFVLLVLGIGIVAGAIAVQQSLENRGHASVFNNVNSAAQITTTTNADGTMGQTTWLGNFSNKLPTTMLGTLDVLVTDPDQGKRPTDVPTPQPTHVLPSQAQGQSPNDKQPSSVNLSSLVITFKKVEIHMDYLGTPGEDSKISPTSGPSRSPLPSVLPTRFPVGRFQTNTPVDHWEVIEMPAPVTVDLVALAKTHDLARLGLTQLAAGQYSEIRLYIDSVTATLSNGTKITPVIPGHANIVRIVERVKVLAGKTTTVTADFDAQNSVIQNGTLYLLTPVVAHFDQANQS